MTGEEHRVVTSSGLAVVLGPARPEDRAALFDLFAGIVAQLDGFPQAPPLTEGDFEAAWGSGVSAVVVARLRSGAEAADESGPAGEDTVVGAYSLKPNFPGRAGHIANAGYVVGAPWRRRGIGRALVEDSMEEARRQGFDAMQFNLVFESNPARGLYEQLGFVVTGRVPAAVDGEGAVIYWRSLL